MSDARRVGAALRSAAARRTLVLLGCGAATLSAAACASTEQESARIGRESQLAAARASQKPKPKAAHGARSHASRRRAHPPGGSSR
jgi:hypothetical protein